MIFTPEDNNRTSAPLNAGIVVERGGSLPSGTIIHSYVTFGNTGLVVVPTFFEGRSKAEWERHFTPEGAEAKVPGYEEKYKDVYAYALDHLLRWWEDLSNFQNLPPRPSYLIGTTNLTFRNYNMRLLGPDIWEMEREEVVQNRYSTRLHLDKLAEDRAIRGKIEERSRQCGSKHYTMVSKLHSTY